jgi:hypothetical protein
MSKLHQYLLIIEGGKNVFFVNNNLYKVLDDVVGHNCNNEDKRQVVRRFLDKENVQTFFLKFAKHGRNIKWKLKLFKSLKVA